GVRLDYASGLSFLIHFPVASRPNRLYSFQSTVQGDETVIADEGVGLIPVVEVLVIVVIGGAPVAQFLHLVTHGQEEILLLDFLHAHTAVGGNQAHQVGKFSGNGAGTPGGLVVVGKLDALGGQAVQGRRQFRV